MFLYRYFLYYLLYTRKINAYYRLYYTYCFYSPRILVVKKYNDTKTYTHKNVYTDIISLLHYFVKFKSRFLL